MATAILSWVCFYFCCPAPSSLPAQCTLFSNHELSVFAKFYFSKGNILIFDWTQHPTPHVHCSLICWYLLNQIICQFINNGAAQLYFDSREDCSNDNKWLYRRPHVSLWLFRGGGTRCYNKPWMWRKPKHNTVTEVGVSRDTGDIWLWQWPDPRGECAEGI